MVFEPEHYGVVLEYVPHGGLDEYLFQNKVRLVHQEVEIENIAE